MLLHLFLTVGLMVDVTTYSSSWSSHTVIVNSMRVRSTGNGVKTMFNDTNRRIPG